LLGNCGVAQPQLSHSSATSTEGYSLRNTHQGFSPLHVQEAYLEKKDFLIARNVYASAIKEAKKKHWNNFLEKEDLKSIFKAVAYTKDLKVERIPPIQGDNLETTFSGKCKVFRKALFPPPPVTEPPSFSSY
jgi:hypothetical protein